jgi:hypothetical protein
MKCSAGVPFRQAASFRIRRAAVFVASMLVILRRRGAGVRSGQSSSGCLGEGDGGMSY